MNPWQEIPFEDYENHMSDPNVGQLEKLSLITKELLDSFKPSSFLLLGCCTGNGLEHIDVSTTHSVICIDINNQYLKVLEQRFREIIPNMMVLNLDIQEEIVLVQDIQLVFGALILEYVDVEKVIGNVKSVVAKGGCIAFVIQKTKKGTFVSATKYDSLKLLASISKEVDESNLSQVMCKNGFVLLQSKNITLNDYKQFVLLIYRKI